MIYSKSNKKVFKVVSKDGLEAATRSGWRLHQVLDESKMVPGSETSYVAAAYQGGSPQPVYNTVARVVQECSFLMSFDGNELIAAIEKRAVDAEQTAYAHLKTVEGLEAQIAENKEEVVRLKKQLEDGATYRQQLIDKLRAKGDVNRKLEVDIGKIRQAVGDLRMKEILES